MNKKYIFILLNLFFIAFSSSLAKKQYSQNKNIKHCDCVSCPQCECCNKNKTLKGVLIGGGVGAGVGAGIGSAVGNIGAGTALGGVGGAILGGLLTKS